MASSSSSLSESFDTDDSSPASDVEALSRFLSAVEEGGTAFQSVAVAAVQILERVLCFEREAADAALSLGQQQKMRSMVEVASEAVTLLRDALEAQGARVMHLCACPPPADAREGLSWWDALNDALSVLKEGTGRMTSLTTAQPEGSPAQVLSRLIAQLLRDHRDALLVEAEEWIA